MYQQKCIDHALSSWETITGIRILLEKLFPVIKISSLGYGKWKHPIDRLETTPTK